MNWTIIEAATSICAALRTGPLPLEGLVQATGMLVADLSPALVLLQGRGYAERRTVNGLRSRWVLAGEAIDNRSALERAWCML